MARRSPCVARGRAARATPDLTAVEALRSAPAPNDERSAVLLLVLGVLAPLAAFVPVGVKAWQKEAFAWDAEVSTGIHDYENRETAWNRHVDVFDIVLNPVVQVLGALLVLALLAVAVSRRQFATAVFIAVGVGGTAVLGLILKEIVFARPPLDEPDSSGHSFPSGHAMRSLSAAIVVTLAAWPTRWRRPVAALGSLTVVLIGVAVVYHEWHWATDVLGGWLVTIAWLASVWLAVRTVGLGGSPFGATTR